MIAVIGRPKGHGYAALARDDVDDAKRGNPGTDLRDYAQARGLEFLDKAAPAGFGAALPGFEEYRFNVMRGVLRGGEFGVLFHQALEVPVTKTPNIDGTLYGVVSKSPGRWWVPKLPNRTDIPIIGDFLDPPTDDRPAEAFDSYAVWIPSTTAAVNVPESALPLYLFRIDRRRHHAPFDFKQSRTLDDLGLPGWRMRSQDPVSDDLVRRLLNGPALDVFRRRADDPFFQLLVLRGTVIARRNGYLRDAAELDALATDLCVLASAIRAACLAEAQPRPFTEALPPAPAASSMMEVTAGWSDGYAKLAQRLGMALEDPDEYHRAYPSLPVPGRAVAVMRGTLPGTQASGRLVYHAERSLKAAERARGAVLLPAPPGAQPTPPGGHRYPDHRLVHENVDGVTVLWSMTTAGFFREEQEGLIERAVALARARGLAQV